MTRQYLIADPAHHNSSRVSLAPLMDPHSDRRIDGDHAMRRPIIGKGGTHGETWCVFVDELRKKHRRAMPWQ